MTVNILLTHMTTAFNGETSQDSVDSHDRQADDRTKIGDPFAAVFIHNIVIGFGIKSPDMNDFDVRCLSASFQQIGNIFWYFWE